MNKNIVLAAAVGIALSATSCRKMLDVNKNPNVASDVTVKALLPAGQLYLGTAMGTDMQINGSIWSQYWTQAPQGREYQQFEQFTPSQDAFNKPWANLYSAAENFYQLYKLADSQGKKPYKAIALLMEAYTFQAITDAWGDVPFQFALQGQMNTNTVMSPAFDSQRVVYHSILDYIDSANALISRSGTGGTPGTDDIIYKGDMQKWKRFGNTLKLKVLLRMAYKDSAYAHRYMDTLYKYNPSFMGMGDDARIVYTANGTNNNPLYSELRGVSANIQQLAASKTITDSMNANNDYRREVVFTKTAAGTIDGVQQSAYNIPLGVGTFSTPSAVTGGDITDPQSANAAVLFMSAAESYYLQAEAVARGWVTTGSSDAVLFQQGMMASFNYFNNELMASKGVTGTQAYTIYVNGDVINAIPAARWSAYPATGTMAAKLRAIITQKWFSMAGTQGFEAWTEWRRTGYPDFLVYPVNSAIGQTHPVRFLYPATEAASNNSYPGLMSIGALVWWDKF